MFFRLGHSKLKYTGERIVPCKPELTEAYYGHLIAYVFASQYTMDRLVLDAGCGTGYGTNHLSKTARQAIGIDVSREAITYCRKNYARDNTDFVQMDATNMGFWNNVFDAICSFQVVEHIRDYDRYLSQMKRILKPCGILVISTPNKKTFNPYGKPTSFHFKEFYREEFEALLREFFKEVEIYGQYKMIKEKRQRLIDALLRIGRSGMLNFMPLRLRKAIEERLVHKIDNPARYKLNDFTIIDDFVEKSSMNIIAVCRKPS